MPPKDYYKILGIPPTSTTQQIYNVYHAVSLTCYPEIVVELDISMDEKRERMDRFLAATKAFVALYDEGRRKEYDRQWALGNLVLTWMDRQERGGSQERGEQEQGKHGDSEGEGPANTEIEGVGHVEIKGPAPAPPIPQTVTRPSHPARQPMKAKRRQPLKLVLEGNPRAVLSVVFGGLFGISWLIWHVLLPYVGIKWMAAFVILAMIFVR